MAVEFFQGIFHNFYIFRIKEKEIPVDTVEVKGMCRIIYLLL